MRSCRSGQEGEPDPSRSLVNVPNAACVFRRWTRIWRTMHNMLGGGVTFTILRPQSGQHTRRRSITRGAAFRPHRIACLPLIDFANFVDPEHSRNTPGPSFLDYEALQAQNSSCSLIFQREIRHPGHPRILSICSRSLCYECRKAPSKSPGIRRVIRISEFAYVLS